MRERQCNGSTRLPLAPSLGCGLALRLGWRVLAILCLVWALAGCTMKYGSPPQVDRLAGLSVGVSTISDVKMALGEPRGEGTARLRPDLPPRKILFYEYVESDGNSTKLKMLMVFTVTDRYDGHLWFSATELLGASQ
jgi:hypothetical protein